jgi:hypothetical protein
MVRRGCGKRRNWAWEEEDAERHCADAKEEAAHARWRHQRRRLAEERNGDGRGLEA